MRYKVFIPTASIGSRLGDITKYTNKSLVKVGKKPSISYIIESYPKNTLYIIALGHFGNQVKDFLKLVYPKRHFKFVNIDKFNDEQGSLLYTFWCSRALLQSPFIYHASDTIVSDHIPLPKKNWLAGFVGEPSSNYSSFNTLGNRIVNIEEKGSLKSDYIHIGMIGIYNYKSFWVTVKSILKKNKWNPGPIGEIDAINQLLAKGHNFTLLKVNEWFDTGNVESLNSARKNIKDSFPILDKLEETMFIFNKSIVKFFAKDELAINRVKRAKLLYPLTPKIIGHKGNFYRYKYVKGKLYSKIATSSTFPRFLKWANIKLWKKNKSVRTNDFKNMCEDFYINKTVKRLKIFYKTRNVIDSKTKINGEQIPKLSTIFKMLDKDWLCDGISSNFHGDFILDNIIKTKKGFRLLDWRQDFAGSLTAGDLYYDLAKLNHNLIINHDIINKNLFNIKVKGSVVDCDILQKNKLVDCQKELFKFVKNNNLDSKKVKTLTAIIWLNMSPLHHHPFDIFLYYFGKYNLWKIINEK